MSHSWRHCSALTAARVTQEGLRQPILVKGNGSLPDIQAALGMACPSNMGEQLLVDVFGPQHIVPVLDVDTQQPLTPVKARWWQRYMAAPSKQRLTLLSVEPLNISGTPLEAQVRTCI